MTQQRPDGGPEQNRLDNGLRARTYVPLTDVDAAVGQHLLAALGRARIAAYLGPGTSLGPDGDVAAVSEQRRLFVASDERVDARTIVAAAVRALGGGIESTLPEASDDPLAGLDADAMFDAIVADWHVDTHVAIRDAERDLTREDADWRARLAKPAADDTQWLDDDHYVPPPPPPLPRLSAPAMIAIALLAVSIVVLGFGASLGLAGNFSVVLGIGGILVSGGILLSRLHEHRRDDDDDGSAV